MPPVTETSIAPLLFPKQSTPVMVSVATSARGSAIVWEAGSGGVYKQTGTQIPTRTRLTDEGNDPVVVSGPSGVVTAWHQRGSQPGVYVQWFAN